MEDILNHCINDITLQVTKNCNFACRYCTFATQNNITRLHQRDVMSFETAKKSVDFLYDNCSDSDNITIAFYGGEPLMNFEIIRYVVDYSLKLFCTKDVRFRMTTNASLLVGNIMDFVVLHNFDLAISLDGDESISGKHRRFKNNGQNSFSIVLANLLELREKHSVYYDKHVSFLPVFMPDENIENVYLFFSSLGISKDKIHPLLSDLNGIDYYSSDIRIESLFNQNDLLEQENQDILFGDIFNEKKKRSKKWHHNGPCIPGVKRLFISTDGKFFSCEKVPEFDEISLGSVYDGFDKERIKQLLNVGQLTENECKECWAWRFCNICYAQCISLEDRQISCSVKPCKYQRENVLKYFKKRIDVFNQKECEEL